MRFEGVNSFAEAVELMATSNGKAKILAGGTDVLVQLKLGLSEPELLIDIKRIPGVKDITSINGKFRIGACVSGAELGEHVELKKTWPGVIEAMELIGSTQVQGRATIVGNICNASPAADTAPALVAANARLEIIGKAGTREILVKDLPKSPGKTNLAADEIVTAVILPKKSDHASDAYLRFIPRTEMDIAVCSAGVCLTIDTDGIITAAQVSLGAVAPTVLLVEAAGAALVGNALDDKTLEALKSACAAACSPIDDRRGTAEFRTKVAGVLAMRAAKIAYKRAGDSQ